MKKIKEYIPGAILIIGAFVFTYELFNYSYSRGCGLGSGESNFFSDSCSNPVAYYYDSETLFALALGTSLILLGILLLRKR